MSEPDLREESSSATAMIEAIADADSRAILGAVATEPKTVADLVEECGIPTATAYRKVSRLTEAGLLAEQLQVQAHSSGRNAATYQLRDVELSVTLEGSVRLEVDCSPVSRDRTAQVVEGDDTNLQAEHLTDGGVRSRNDAPETRADRLRTLFVDVTGTDEVVVEQNVDFPSRDVDDDAVSISTYVAAVTKNDGLTDTIDDPDLGSSE